MNGRRDSFTLLREQIRWRFAVSMCVFGMLMLALLGVLNARSGRTDSVWLSIVVFGILAISLAMLMLLPRALGGKVYFWITVAVLVYLPWFGFLQGRTFHYWAYVFPPVLFFLMRPIPALICMIVFGLYVCAMLVPIMPAIDVARVGLSYFLLVGFMYTYAQLEETAAIMLRYHSDRDALSNCYNRRIFNERLEQIEQPPGTACAFLLIDIDRFKAINDQLGHMIGDRVITRTAAALGRELAAEMPLFRYGGEEFAVVLAGVEEAEAGDIAERMREAVAAGDFGGVRVTVSIGVSCWMPTQGTVAAALATADRALYAAKHGGRNLVVRASEVAV